MPDRLIEATCAHCGREGIALVPDGDQLVVSVHSPLRMGKHGLYSNPDEICPGHGQPPAARRSPRPLKAA